MKIKFNENGYVEGYVTLGDMEGAVEFDGAIPESFAENCRFCHLVDGELVLDEEKLAAAEQAEILRGERTEIYSWFAWYDNQVMQYTRAVRRGEPFDLDIEVLDAEAAAKQLRIREIRTILGEE